MTNVYGPVPSRRLGRSLGVDPIPLKTCNYNCVYCQLGRTKPLVHERRDYFAPDQIMEELKEHLSRHGPGEIDYITFVGQGEPLLCASLGRLIRGAKALSSLPVAIITNGSLLPLPEVRKEVSAADVVMPSLDAADEATFRRIARPWPRLHVADIIDGLIQFRGEFAGQLWVEVMLVKGINDKEATLFGLRDALARIHPDQIHINLPVRPPAEKWVESPDEQDLMRAVGILGGVARVVMPCDGDFDLDEALPLAEAISEVVRRHPMRMEEIQAALEDREPALVEAALGELVSGGRVQRVEHGGHVFWRGTQPRG